MYSFENQIEMKQHITDHGVEDFSQSFVVFQNEDMRLFLLVRGHFIQLTFVGAFSNAKHIDIWGEQVWSMKYKVVICIWVERP